MSRQMPDELTFLETKIDLIEELSDGKIPSQKPTATIVVGQPGSGKSYLTKSLYKDGLPNNEITIDNDELKLKHPFFQEFEKEKGSEETMVYVHPFASKMGKELVKHFTNEKYNIVFESTGKNLDSLVNMVGQFKDNNYEVNLIVLATNKEVSRLQVENRYLRGMLENPKEARNVPLEVQEQTIKNLPINIDALYMSGEIDNLEIYTTEYDGEKYSHVQIYNSNDDYYRLFNISPRDVLENVIHNLDDRTKQLLEQVDKENAELKLEFYDKEKRDKEEYEEEDYDM